ncbi:hypothetical protein [Halobacterium wangiae]|uniref:hypothetical protein n=1 Tax=Halobacterium wangiae TaxID=2902623 RepID=UPI001E374B07|nr:hypothetical protein [Halobacterium wangiae]
MSRVDSEYESGSNSNASTETVNEPFLERHSLAVKVAVFYAVTLGVWVLLRGVVESPNAETFTAIGFWFTVIFAVLTALLGGVIEGLEVMKRYRQRGR